MGGDKAVTLGVTHFASAVCTVLLISRVCYRYQQPRRGPQSVGRRLLGDDYWCAVALVPLILRWGVIHAAIVLGTNSAPKAIDLGELSKEEIERRVLGSQMVLVARLMFPLFIWMMKGSLMVFYGRLVVDHRHYRWALNFLWGLLPASYIAIVISLLAPCYPLRAAWQVYPPPPEDCIRVTPYLYTTAALNISTDIMLLMIPLPLIFRSIMPRIRKIQFASLFSLCIICIVLSAVRTPVNRYADALQNSRTLFSSLEVLASCIVANAPALHGIWRDWRTERFVESEQTRMGTMGGSMSMRTRNGTVNGAERNLKRRRSYDGIAEEDEMEDDVELAYGRLSGSPISQPYPAHSIRRSTG